MLTYQHRSKLSDWTGLDSSTRRIKLKAKILHSSFSKLKVNLVKLSREVFKIWMFFWRLQYSSENLHLPPKLSFSSKHIVTAIKLANIILTLQICVWSLFYYLSICVQNLSSQCCFLEIKMRFLLTRRLRFWPAGVMLTSSRSSRIFFLTSNHKNYKL